jgi:hypothetical protein
MSMRTIVLLSALLLPGLAHAQDSPPCSAMKTAEDRLNGMIKRDLNGEYVNQDVEGAASVAYVIAKQLCEHPNEVLRAAKPPVPRAPNSDEDKLNKLIDRNR